MNRSILILGLETLKEQLIDSGDVSEDILQKLMYVNEELDRLKSPATPSDKAAWLDYTLDMEAEEMFGEFGFDTLNPIEKREVLKELFERELLN